MIDVKAVKEAVSQFLIQLGYIPLDLHVRWSQTEWKISTSIFHPGIVTMKDCTEALRALQDFLIGWLGNEDFSLDVASPGAERILKSPLEYSLFRGKRVKLVLKSGKEAFCIIEGLNEREMIAEFLSENSQESFAFPLQEIAKCQLVL